MKNILLLLIFCFLGLQLQAQKGSSQGGAIERLAISADGRYAASSVEHEVVVWDIASGKPIFKQILPNSGGYWSLSNLYFSPDGSKLLCLGAPSDTYIVELSTGRVNTAAASSHRFPSAVFHPDGARYFALKGNDLHQDDYENQREIALKDLSGKTEWSYAVDENTQIGRTILLPKSNTLVFTTKSNKGGKYNLLTIQVGSSQPEFVCSFASEYNPRMFADASETRVFVNGDVPFVMDLGTKLPVWKSGSDMRSLAHFNKVEHHYECNAKCPFKGFYYHAGGEFTADGKEFYLYLICQNSIGIFTVDASTGILKDTRMVPKVEEDVSVTNYFAMLPSKNVGLVVFEHKVGEVEYSTITMVDFTTGVPIKQMIDGNASETLVAKEKARIARAEDAEADAREEARREAQERQFRALTETANPDFASIQIGDYLNVNGRLYEVFFGTGSDEAVLGRDANRNEVRFARSAQFTLVRPENKTACSKCSWKSNVCPICEGKSRGTGGQTTQTYNEDVYKTVIDQNGNATKVFDGTRTVTKEIPSNSNSGPCGRCGGTGTVSTDCSSCNGRGWMLK